MVDLLTQALNDAVEQFQSMLAAAIAYAPRLLAGLLVGLLALIAARLIRRWARRVTERIQAPEAAEQLLINAAYVIALLIGATLTLSVLGVNVYGLVAGMGISGLVVGFALKDIIENWLAGVLLLIMRPFALGDTVEIAGVTGSVVEVRVQITTIRTFDNEKVIIPNREVYGKIIKDFNAYGVRRRQVGLGLAYETDLLRAIRLLLETVRSVEGVSEDLESFVTLDDFGDSAIKATLYYYIDIRQYSYADTHTAVVAALQEAVDREGIELPFPTQVVINR